MLLASGLSAGKLWTLDSIISGIGREAGSRWRPAGERHSSVNVQYVIRDLFVSRALAKKRGADESRNEIGFYPKKR